MQIQTSWYPFAPLRKYWLQAAKQLQLTACGKAVLWLYFCIAAQSFEHFVLHAFLNWQSGRCVILCQLQLKNGHILNSSLLSIVARQQQGYLFDQVTAKWFKWWTWFVDIFVLHANDLSSSSVKDPTQLQFLQPGDPSHRSKTTSQCWFMGFKWISLIITQTAPQKWLSCWHLLCMPLQMAGPFVSIPLHPLCMPLWMAGPLISNPLKVSGKGATPSFWNDSSYVCHLLYMPFWSAYPLVSNSLLVNDNKDAPLLQPPLRPIPRTRNTWRAEGSICSRRISSFNPRSDEERLIKVPLVTPKQAPVILQ